MIDDVSARPIKSPIRTRHDDVINGTLDSIRRFAYVTNDVMDSILRRYATWGSKLIGLMTSMMTYIVSIWAIRDTQQAFGDTNDVTDDVTTFAKGKRAEWNAMK